jgi:hypothetical protein
MDKLEYLLNSYEIDKSEQAVEITLYQIEKEIDNVFRKIKETILLSDANSYFDLLDKTQLLLAKMSFKDGVVLSPNLKKFVYDFDRIDDFDQKTYLYSVLKSGGNYFA